MCSSDLSVNGCNTQLLSLTVSNIVTSASAGTILCNGGTTTVAVTASSGVAPYSGTGNFTVGAGSYTYTVTDSKGCTSSATVNISQPTALVASGSVAPILCFGGTTTLVVTATGGTQPYTGTGSYTRSAGTYSYTVRDAKNCPSTVSGTLTQPTQIGRAHV